MTAGTRYTQAGGWYRHRMAPVLAPHLQHILPLGWAACDPGPEHIAAAVGNPAQAAEVLDFNKVTLRAREVLGNTESPDAVDLRRRLDALTKWKRARAKSLSAVWALIQDAASGPGLTVAVMKGAAARAWYPRPAERNVNDLDIWVPDDSSAWILADSLQAAGWRYNNGELPWVKATADGTAYGVINLLAPARDVPQVDLHYGAYSVRHCAYLCVGTGRALVPTADGWVCHEDADVLAAILANAAGDAFVTVKDINDAVLCACRAQVEWQRVRHLLDVAGLREFAASVALAAAVVYGDVTQPVPAVEVLRSELGGRRPERVPVAIPVGRWHRASITTRHSWRIGARSGWWAGAHRLVTAMAYYTARLAVRVVRGPGSPISWTAQPRPWRCLRLVPLHLAAGLLRGGADAQGELRPPVSAPGEFRREMIAGVSVVQVCRETFVPTVYGRLSAGKVTRLVREVTVNGEPPPPG